ncbi:MAG: surface carbohydrate biosynthesis protein [Cyclobacteriaceae bacterium]
MTSKRLLIIPVEVKAREFYSRLMVALESVNIGFDVIFGSQDQIVKYIDRIPAGLYFDKSISINKQIFFESLVRNKWKITAIDEEGLMAKNNTKRYLTKRLNTRNLELVDKLFTWGTLDHDLIVNNYPDFQDKIHVTGNPRIDILRSGFRRIYEKKSREYSNLYGKYVLFPSSFSVNHALGKNGFNRLMSSLGRVSTKDDQEAYEQKYSFLGKTLAKVYSLLESVAQEIPDKNIIIRPHPSEDPFIWKSLASKYSNVHVKFEGSVIPWIMGSEFVVHSTCTTGLESALLNKRTISYIPYANNEHVTHIANEVSVKFDSAPDLIEYLKVDTSTDWNFDQETLKVLSASVSNYFDHNSYLKIAEHLSEIKIGSVGNFKFSIPTLDLLKDFFRPFLVLLGYKRRHFRYLENKFDKMDSEEIQRFVLVYNDVNEKNIKPDIRKLTKNMYLLSNGN